MTIVFTTVWSITDSHRGGGDYTGKGYFVHCPVLCTRGRPAVTSQTGPDHSTTAWWHPPKSEDTRLSWTTQRPISNMTLDSLSEEVKVILTRIKAQNWTRPDTLIAPHSQHKLSQCNCNALSQCIVSSDLLRPNELHTLAGGEMFCWLSLSESSRLKGLLIQEGKDAAKRNEIFWIRVVEHWGHSREIISICKLMVQLLRQILSVHPTLHFSQTLNQRCHHQANHNHWSNMGFQLLQTDRGAPLRHFCEQPRWQLLMWNVLLNLKMSVYQAELE